MYIEHLSIGYESPLCSPVSAELHRGDFVCLVGRNGSGKSTLLRTLAGLQAPLGGNIRLDTDAPLSHAIAIVLTALPQLHHTTVRQLVASGRLPYTDLIGTLTPADYDVCDEALCAVGIQHLAPRLFHTLSDGEKQKTMLARALAQGSPYLLLDEPTAFLDYPSRSELFLLLSRLAHDQRKAILLSTHDLPLALASAHKIWLIKDHVLTISDPQGFDISNI